MNAQPLTETQLLAREKRAVLTRMERLRVWVGSEWFRRAKKGDRRDALAEVQRIRDDLTALRLRLRSKELDDKNWKDARDWVESDAGETKAEVLATISNSIDIRIGESDKDYYARLMAIRRGFSRRAPTTADNGAYYEGK